MRFDFSYGLWDNFTSKGFEGEKYAVSKLLANRGLCELGS